MKKLILLSALIPFALIGQERPDSTRHDTTDHHQKKFVKFISISGYSGVDFFRDGYEDRTLFQQAVPGSAIALADISGHTNYWNDAYFETTASTAGLNVNLHLRCQKRFGELRFGIAHSYASISSQTYFQETEYRLDTTALPGGEILYTDSVATSVYAYDWDSDVIQLHLGWIIRTDPRQWVNLYTGIGFFGGIGYNGTIAMTHYHNSYFQHYTESGGSGINYTTNHDVITSVHEEFRAPSFTSFGIYTPIGMNVRLGRRNSVLRHLAIFGEYNGAIQFVNPEGTTSKIRTASSIYGGVRWYVHAPGKPKHNGKGKHGGRHRHHHHSGNQQNGTEPH